MSTTTRRVINHTRQDLLVAVPNTREKKDAPTYAFYVLPPEGTSPPDVKPEYVVAPDNQVSWRLSDGANLEVVEQPDKEGRIHPVGFGVRFASNGPLKALNGTSTPTLWKANPNQIAVTVLGAGITGLTVAHELSARGFFVQVIERAHGDSAGTDVLHPTTLRSMSAAGANPFEITEPDIGGLARTQWSTMPAPAWQPTPALTPTPPGPVAPNHPLKTTIWRGAGAIGDVPGDEAIAYGVPFKGSALSKNAITDVVAWVEEKAAAGPIAGLQLSVIIYTPDVQAVGKPRMERIDEAYERLRTFVSEWIKVNPMPRLRVLPTTRLEVRENSPLDKQPYVGLIVRLHSDLRFVAGEHGFRFFPGFYRHLRDTMRRTPIFDEKTQEFTERTTRDHLQEVRWQVIAEKGRPFPAPLSRKPFQTLGGLLEQYRNLRADLGYRPVDLIRFFLRILRYATSSSTRRARQLETMSWYEFLTRRHLDGSSVESFVFGKRFDNTLKHAPRALLAMDPEKCDARTLGNINVQLMMDQFDLHEQSDSTLSGPTTTTWLEHWKRYLVAQGVRFLHGEITAIRRGTGKLEPPVVVDVAWPSGRPPYLDPNSDHEPHYIVSALDLPALAAVTSEVRKTKSAPGVLADLDDWVRRPGPPHDRDLHDIRNIGGDDDFQTLSGIQFYFSARRELENGHVYFANTPWGLSAISQVQYWGPFRSGVRSKLLSNLSVDIGNWAASGTTTSPNDHSHSGIAAEVIDQISSCLGSQAINLPRSPNGEVSITYHLDDYIEFGVVNGQTLPVRNRAPFLINRTGRWGDRPRGEPWSPNSRRSRGRVPGHGHYLDAGGQPTPGPTDVWAPAPAGYLVHFDRLVVAGPHMRTFTRLGTMESANESARHAVNAILDHVTWKRPAVTASLKDARHVYGDQPRPNEAERVATPYGDYCEIWDPEQCEFADLVFLREIDEQLLKLRGGEHGDDVPDRPHRAYTPHLFDLLRIDELPDFMDPDDDGAAMKTFELLTSLGAAFNEATGRDAPSVLAVVDRFTKKVADLIHGLRRRRPT